MSPGRHRRPSGQHNHTPDTASRKGPSTSVKAIAQLATAGVAVVVGVAGSYGVANAAQPGPAEVHPQQGGHANSEQHHRDHGRHHDDHHHGDHHYDHYAHNHNHHISHHHPYHPPHIYRHWHPTYVPDYRGNPAWGHHWDHHWRRDLPKHHHHGHY